MTDTIADRMEDGRSPSGRATCPTDGAASSTASPAKPSIPNAVFAVAPTDWCADYLTRGRAYAVIREEVEAGAFVIINDGGTESYCLWEWCAHLRGPDGRGGSWKRMNAPAASAIEAATAGETAETGSTEGESATREAGDAQP